LFQDCGDTESLRNSASHVIVQAAKKYRTRDKLKVLVLQILILHVLVYFSLFAARFFRPGLYHAVVMSI
jgi:capsule polysaccharide export protein KpsE/RkpR